MTQAISDFGMIEEGDRILVAVSGGKDSAVMLWLLQQIQRLAKVSFDLTPVILDQKQPGFDVRDFARWISQSTGLKLEIIEEDTFSIVKEKTEPGKAYCRICSRLRRGILYSYAAERGYHKIALGHHRDDLNQTLLLNLFYAGSLGAMPAKLLSDDGRNTVIRPLAYVPEEWIEKFSADLSIPIIPCNLCGSQEGLKREKMKKLLRSLEQDLHPHVGASILNAQKNIRMSQLLGNDSSRSNLSEVQL